ncbi:MAG: hypothetical protein ACQEQV_01595 [Fibrobacterota bacterium]
MVRFVFCCSFFLLCSLSCSLTSSSDYPSWEVLLLPVGNGRQAVLLKSRDTSLLVTAGDSLTAKERALRKKADLWIGPGMSARREHIVNSREESPVEMGGLHFFRAVSDTESWLITCIGEVRIVTSWPAGENSIGGTQVFPRADLFVCSSRMKERGLAGLVAFQPQRIAMADALHTEILERVFFYCSTAAARPVILHEDPLVFRTDGTLLYR